MQEIFGFDEFFRETLAHQLFHGFHFQVSQLRVEFFDVLTVVLQCAGYLKYKNPKLKFCKKLLMAVKASHLFLMDHVCQGDAVSAKDSGVLVHKDPVHAQ